MEFLISLQKSSVSTCRVTSTSISWQTPGSCLIFPYSEIIGCKMQKTSFELLIFHSKKDKFKTYTLEPYDRDMLVKIVNRIKSHLLIDSKRFAVFINPISGKGLAEKTFEVYLRPLMEIAEVLFTVFKITSSEYFQSFEWEQLSGFTHVIVLGGDGTVQELLTCLFRNGMINNFAYGVLPVGSQNALSCEMTGKSLNSAILSILKSTPTLCDLLKVTLDHQTFICTTAVSWGLISAISDNAQYYRFLGPFRYYFSSALQLFKSWTSFVCELKLENSVKTSEFLTVLMGNHSTRSFYGSEVAFPNGNITDGFIDLQQVAFTSRIGAVQLFADMGRGGEHVKQPIVSYSKEKFVELTPHNHAVFNLDGEIKYGQQLRVEILHKFINFLRN